MIICQFFFKQLTYFVRDSPDWRADVLTLVSLLFIFLILIYAQTCFAMLREIFVRLTTKYRISGCRPFCPKNVLRGVGGWLTIVPLRL
uniref:Ion_trans domain-containing protein n=1 Tax=Strongyloides venezuelensis TaxID=75913 RepID=A0A0K0G5J5_STRVS